MKKSYQFHLIAIGLYTTLTLILTWPLARYFTSHIPGEVTWAFDESTFIWNMWWLKFSLLNLQQTPLISTYTFFPLGVDLTTYTFNLFHAAFGLPLQLALSLPLANNLTLLFSYISSAYGTFLLSLYLLQGDQLGMMPGARQSGANVSVEQSRSGQNSKIRSPKSIVPYLAAFIAGTVFAFSASRMMYVALGHYNFVTIQWFPFYTLYLIKTLRRGTFKNSVLTSLFAALCLYAELTFSVFLLFLTLFVLLAEWMRQRTSTFKGSTTKLQKRTLIQFSLSLCLIGLFTFALTSPFILSVLPDFLDPDFNQPGWGEGLKLSADLVGLVTVTPLHPLSGLDWISELRAVIEGSSRFSDANTLFLGYGVLSLALVGFIVRRKTAKSWLWSAIFFTILSLGPLLTINGQNRFNLDGIEVTFPLPFALLHYIPILSANRVPNRFGIPLTLALAVLVGYSIAWMLNKLTRRTSFSKIALLISPPMLLISILFDQYSAPLPLTDARIPDAYYQIGAEPDDFTIMQLPLGWRNSYGTLGAERTRLQYFQAAHQRPMLGGNTSRNPRFKFDYFADVPLIRALTEVELYRNPDEDILEQARQQTAELLTLYNLKYLVIHDPLPFRKPYEDTFLATRKLALELIPHNAEAVYRSPGVEVFAVEQADIPNPLTIDLGDLSSNPYRGPGWDRNEEIYAATANWVVASEAEIFFPVRGSGDRQVAVHIAPFSYPGMPVQKINLQLNNQPLDGNYLLQEGWQQVNFRLPESRLINGLNRLTLIFAETARPRQILPATTTIGATGVAAPLDLEVNSGADFAFITVGFDDKAVDASAHRRGINIATVDPQSGEIINFKGFDTAANEFEAAALDQYIRDIPPGYIVIVATQGLDATAFFTAETGASLQALGLSAETQSPPFSAIGVKDAPSGSAFQAAGAGTAYLRLGANPDTRPLAGAVDKIVISLP